jgi:hypothetical protein
LEQDTVRASGHAPPRERAGRPTPPAPGADGAGAQRTDLRAHAGTAGEGSPCTSASTPATRR